MDGRAEQRGQHLGDAHPDNLIDGVDGEDAEADLGDGWDQVEVDGPGGLRHHVSVLARKALEGLAEISCEMLAELANDDELYEAMDEVFEAQVPAMHERFERELTEAQYEHHVSPVIDMLEMLPREELAVAAEALVSLQSLKQRMTMKVESVSGSIDVVMISKGDGLVWVKRK